MPRRPLRLLRAVRDLVAVFAVVAAYLPAVLLALVVGAVQRILDRRSLVGASAPQRQQPLGVGLDEGALPIDGPAQLHTGLRPR